MKKSDISRLRELVDLNKSRERYKARLSEQGQTWCLVVQLNGEMIRFWNEQPWVVEDWPRLDWIGSYFFHRSCNGVYLVHGAARDFNGSVFRPRLRAFKKMVRWAMPQAKVGFTTLDTVSEKWGYTLISPWLIKSTDPVWLRRLKMFQALNSYDPTHWPMSLMIEKWPDFREIRL